MSKQNASSVSPATKGRILSTEDDPDTRDLVRLLLELEGLELVYTDNAEEALSLARTTNFDLYLLDNWVPGLGGEDLCRKLREFDQTTPILFYSGAGHESDKDGAIAAGAKGYVIKPADPDELIVQIFKLIAPQGYAGSQTVNRSRWDRGIPMRRGWSSQFRRHPECWKIRKQWPE